MSSVYTVKPGDTLDSVAVRVYGDPGKKNILLKANPIASEGLQDGQVLTIPDDAGLARIFDQTKKQTSSIGDNELKVVIGEFELIDFIGLSVETSVGRIADSFSVTFTWDLNEGVKNLIRPFTYEPVYLYLNGVLVLKGVKEVVSNVVDSNNRYQVTISGRSSTGVLTETVNPRQPYQFLDKDLKYIAQQLCEPLGLSVDFKSATGGVFECVSMAPGESIFSFLARLSAARGFLVAADETGSLVFWDSGYSDENIGSIVEGEYPYMTGGVVYDGIARFSDYIVLAQSKGDFSVKSFSKDAGLNGVSRPLTKIGNSLTAGNVDAFAGWERGRAFGRSHGLKIQVSSWLSQEKKLWKKNKRVTINSPGLQVYSDTEYIIKGVELLADVQGGRRCNLELVLPSTYTTELPEEYPWD